MRIIKEWSYEDMKCTLFLMSGKYSLKLEMELLEQTYKFRDGIFSQASDLTSMLNSDFYQEALAVFKQMKVIKVKLSTNSQDQFNFPSII